MKPLGSSASPLAKITTLSFNDNNTTSDFNDEDFEGIIPQKEKEGKQEEEEEPQHEAPQDVDDDELL